MREKISILIPAGNEESNIVACIQSARWADEVVVVDSFSSDRTVELARPLADRVLQHEYINSATQKNWAIPQMSHEWVMVLDADERVSTELRDEILRILEKGAGDACAFRIWRRNHFMGKPLRFCWRNDSCVRLFRRDRARYQDREVHADIVCDGPILPLKGRLLHFTHESFAQYMAKFDRYTTWAAGDRAKRTARVGFIHLALRPAWRFFRRYILNLWCLDGKAGFIISAMGAFSVFLKYAKLWERQEKEKGRNDSARTPDADDPGRRG
ncbi:MAG: glycosyltransferase family 2 protein [Candidatus Sumerlaeota bacterium]|nr:glycosyltransferase family 2 protein [Candidatus Sumerlaeota bacterium]